jgi:hypothetical protein
MGSPSSRSKRRFERPIEWTASPKRTSGPPRITAAAIRRKPTKR